MLVADRVDGTDVNHGRRDLFPDRSSAAARAHRLGAASGANFAGLEAFIRGNCTLATFHLRHVATHARRCRCERL